MHEVSIMQNSIKIVLEKAEENNIKNISKITIKIGELSGVMSDSLIFAFNSLSKGTIAEGAEFLIEKVKATAMCNDCDIVFEIDHFNKLCPNCNKFSTNILSGYELYVNTIEGE
ncbi:hydrogenase maturation nickel metallochaperone HypA [Clostridium sp. DJ247]|uniref:hydrogenase maturation nickel metallochaperone HypA n=1 Tax=Clostridium sp. DJ247 TaxID=2726188 RepID=UPI001624BD50|nr:hydrogenase maturation nickel metallochaperone HypA [Clostridium sp. DJ247]MBC2582453.1 hydrogenase maturation nickel metallochaperone HypA [Clostridium sp. DJ247]